MMRVWGQRGSLVPHAVCQKIGRAHYTGSLIVNDPASQMLEALCLEEIILLRRYLKGIHRTCEEQKQYLGKQEPDHKTLCVIFALYYSHSIVEGGFEEIS